MDSKSFTRVLIETAVERGIRDVTDDPKRSLRRLAELGRQYSEGRFQKVTFGHIANLLKNDDSPYYKMLEDFLANVDHSSIKTFGLNIGYDSWTYGARIIRKESESRGYMLPWIVQIHYDDTARHGISAGDINTLICRLKPLGINTYIIVREHGADPDPALSETISSHPECAFFMFVNDARISSEETEMLKKTGNTVISVNIAEECAHDTCRLLREKKALFVIHYAYTRDEAEDLFDEDLIEAWLSYGSAFIFLIQRDGDDGPAGEFARRSRMDQKYPILIWDLYSDIRLINEMISDTPFILEIDSSGNVMYPSGTDMNIKGKDIISILEQIAPHFPPRQP